MELFFSQMWRCAENLNGPVTSQVFSRLNSNRFTVCSHNLLTSDIQSKKRFFSFLFQPNSFFFSYPRFALLLFTPIFVRQRHRFFSQLVPKSLLTREKLVTLSPSDNGQTVLKSIENNRNVVKVKYQLLLLFKYGWCFSIFIFNFPESL
jgi:hypothetical protein